MNHVRHKSFPRLTGKNAAVRLGAIPCDASPIVITSNVIDRVLQVSDNDPNIEVGGFLLGSYCRDETCQQAFIEIDEYTPALQADHQFQSLTFTHDSWSRLHSQLATQFPTHQVVGWHHTHPGFGIFLSRQDEFIHRNFFDQPWQVAMVVDPRRGELGFFQWRNDEIVDAGFLITR